MNCSMSPLNKAKPPVARTPNGSGPYPVLAREAGVPFQPPRNTVSEADPFAEWLSLMEVVQMLCPVWPLHSGPMLGKHWRL